MNLHLATLGCRLNEGEIQSWAREFSRRGVCVVESSEQADIVVLNTCAVTAEATRKSLKLLRRLQRLHPGARVVLTGCHATLSPDETEAMAGIELVIGNVDKDRLVDIVLERLDVPEMASRTPESARTRAFVKVQDGCRNRCAFCVVRLARGPERSRTIPDVVRELQELEASGVREVVLTGVHLGGYGSDQGTDLKVLVEAVLAETSLPRIRLGSLEPWDIPEGFFDLWHHHPSLGPHLHLPLQSGSDRVLRAMARRHDTAAYEALVGRARAEIEGLTVTTDLLVGFPGETDEDWRETVRFIRRIGFAHLHIFVYSSRPGTRAAQMPDHVPEAVKRARSREAHGIASSMKAAYLEGMVGTARAVLWEKRRLVDRTRAVWTGYTDNYVGAQTEVSGPLELANRITPARLVALTPSRDRLYCEIGTPETV